MIYRSGADLIEAGWSEIVDDGFIGLVGPLWQRVEGGEASIGFLADRKHRNRTGVVQGGMLATLADRALGLAVRMAEPDRAQSTVQLNIQYLESARLGEFVSATGCLLRDTRNLAFVSGRIESDGRLIGHASGVWRIRRGTTVSR